MLCNVQRTFCGHGFVGLNHCTKVGLNHCTKVGLNHCTKVGLGLQEAQHMEWVDDVLMFMRKGAGSPRAYQMAAPLLADIATSLQVTPVPSPFSS